jgi:hypothetical protein
VAEMARQFLVAGVAREIRHKLKPALERELATWGLPRGARRWCAACGQVSRAARRGRAC